MKFTDVLKRKLQNNFEEKACTIVFLGDSVTQGCFELYQKNDGCIETYFDPANAYHKKLAEIFAVLCPSVPINIINSGISGDNAVHACARIERDVLCYSPDLVVVCFGLNDAGRGIEGLEDYKKSLAGIFKKLKGTEVIFMTPNMMNTELSCHLKNDAEKEIVRNCMKLQNEGVMDAYMAAAREVCIENNVTICDCYAKWKRLSELGMDTTELLANKINHPKRDMNWLFAFSLAETILGM